jgi:hypothetical protein
MLHTKNYVAGWLDSSIRDFLEDLPRNAKSIRFALITCIDSNRAPATLLTTSPELRSLASQARSIGNDLLLPTDVMLAHERQIFFGFDEVWFFPSDDITEKPDVGSLVGPSRVDQSTLDCFQDWISTNRCSLALGDGEGLNFIVKAHGLVRHLLGHSLHQPNGHPNAFLGPGTTTDTVH